jgi:hypothetical protein
MEDPNSNYDPAAALAEIHSARAEMAERFSAHSWRYDIPYALLAGGMVAVQAAPAPLNILGISVCIIALVALMRVWSKRTGVWISGVSPPRARWVALALGLVVGVAAIIVALFAMDGVTWVAWPAAVVTVVLAFIGSRLWRRLYRADVHTQSGGYRSPKRMLAVVAVALIAISLGVFAYASAQIPGGVKPSKEFWIGMFVGFTVVMFAGFGVLRLRGRFGACG